MPAKPSGQVKTSIIHEPQKNGDIYVYERETIYLPEKRYNKVLGLSLLVGGAAAPAPVANAIK